LNLRGSKSITLSFAVHWAGLLTFQNFITKNMTDLLEELGSLDDENYIYLDKDGKAQKKVEITVHWNIAPQKLILVTCNAK